MRASFHALDRYREHHPSAEGADLLLSAKWGDRVSPELVQALCGRKHLDLTSTYIVAPDKKGIFVISVDSDLIITYLRLGDSQMRVLAPSSHSTGTEDLTPEAPLEQEVVAPAPSRKERLAAKSRARFEALELAAQEARYADWIPAMRAAKAEKDGTVS